MRTLSHIALGISLSGIVSPDARASRPSSRPAEKSASVLKAADELAAAVRARDLTALLRFVAPDGVPCIDSAVSQQELAKQLRTRDTWLGAYFFAPERFNQEFASPYIPMSFAEFLAAARELRSTVPGGQDQRYPCVRFVASNMEWSPEFCFRRYRGRWVLGDLPNCA